MDSTQLTAAMTQIETAMASGRILKSSIMVDGQQVVFQSMKDQLYYYNYLKSLVPQSTGAYTNGRSVIGDPGDGLR